MHTVHLHGSTTAWSEGCGKGAEPDRVGDGIAIGVDGPATVVIILVIVIGCAGAAAPRVSGRELTDRGVARGRIRLLIVLDDSVFRPLAIVDGDVGVACARPVIGAVSASNVDIERLIMILVAVRGCDRR